MTEPQIELLIEQKGVPDETSEVICVETHISWVLLTDQFAYKIKKPLQFSFLDFSTLEQRKFFCEREIELNSRLTSGVYLEVLPIYETNQNLHIGAIPNGEIVDYTVKMKRLDSSSQMDKLLRNNQVEAFQIEQLATQLAAFHTETNVVRDSFDLEELDSKFADLLDIEVFVLEQWGNEARERLEEIVAQSTQFLQEHAERFRERNERGFVIDGHGDLHSGNIFLLDEPVIFDCIEFNDHFRHVDMLDEIAFLCMDLDFFDRLDFAELFLGNYLDQMQCIENEADWQIFHYYKLYRANVRLKVTCLRAMQENDSDDFEQEITEAQKYFRLLEQYSAHIL